MPVRFGNYLKAAFLNRWNLLLLAGGLAFALLSSRADVFAPIVAAAEVGYLGLLGTHPRFQQYVDAQEAKAVREAASFGRPRPEVMAQRILVALPDELVRRFEGIRSRAAELRQLALELREPDRLASPQSLEEMQLAGLDRLLWMYLRLLFTQHSLERFLAKTDERQIQADIGRLEKKLGELPAGDDPQKQKLREVLTDNLATSRTRQENLQKARENCEFVKLQLDSLENKIRSLCEQAVNRHEPEFISGQVDQVVSGMVQTEQTMTELQFLTGLDAADESVPSLLHRQAPPMVR